MQKKNHIKLQNIFSTTLELNPKTVELILKKMALVHYDKFVVANDTFSTSHNIKDDNTFSYCEKIREEEKQKLQPMANENSKNNLDNENINEINTNKNNLSNPYNP